MVGLMHHDVMPAHASAGRLRSQPPAPVHATRLPVPATPLPVHQPAHQQPPTSARNLTTGVLRCCARTGSTGHRLHDATDLDFGSKGTRVEQQGLFPA
jgi:hypothetical protein